MPPAPLYPHGPHKVEPRALISPQLTHADEYIEGAFAGNLGEILIRCVLSLQLTHPACTTPTPYAPLPRCNNVLYVRGLPEGSVAITEAPAAAADAPAAEAGGDGDGDVKLAGEGEVAAE